MFTPQRLSPLLCLLLLILMPFQSAWSATPLKLTQSQVGQIASVFLQKIGHPLASNLALYASEPNHPEVKQSSTSTLSSSDEDRQTKWHVTVPDPNHTQDIEVEDGTGHIVYYRQHDDRPDHQPLGAPISKEQAVAKATSALNAAGVLKTQDLTLKEAFLDRYSDDGEEWFVSWTRVYKKIPYREQGANVGVNSQTGDVTGFSVNFHTSPPDSSVFNISREQAEKIAAKQMASADLQISQPSYVQSEVVQPNGFWQSGGIGASKQPYARVAWTCRYAAGARSYEVWVDAATGEVIGGQVVGGRGRIRIPRPGTPSKH